ncbi:patatin-like phospholipase family protein [Corallococcus exercitus]|uniref:patatin-like phospholipase family protein n=1 Tax=Corallococcus exercitus TaxID=2316736 RepID=UPI0035D4B4E8
MTQPHAPQDRPQVIVVFQGGGALGAYHVGAYQALEEAGLHPDWVSGISIGAFTAALVAGNRPEKRLERLEAFWREVSWPGTEWGSLLKGHLRQLFNLGSHMTSLLFGQPGFYSPRMVPPMLALPGSPEALSFYSTRPMRSTLRRLVDFDYINSRATRLSLGATRVSDGHMVFFDNTRGIVGPEHVLASGALPPAFPPSLIDGELYWDGGCVTNTPLNAILDDPPKRHAVVFMIDLFDARAPLPTAMDEANWRMKSIQYAGRTSHQVEQFAKVWNLRSAVTRVVRRASASSPMAFSDEPEAKPTPRLDIIHLTYQRGEHQLSSSDAEFSRASIAERRADGYRDMRRALATCPWTQPAPDGGPQAFSDDDTAPAGGTALVHRVEGDAVHTQVPLS